jgi:hypothetical protein
MDDTAARVGETGKPSRARRIAGANTSAIGTLPNRSCNAMSPSTQPGTVTAWMSWRNGIRSLPCARSRSASAPDPARPLALSATGGSPGATTIANRSPPRPHMCGEVTAMAPAAAMAASTALPPR